MKYDMTKGLFVQLSADDIEKIEYIHGKEQRSFSFFRKML